jgi:hypothetical protein
MAERYGITEQTVWKWRKRDRSRSRMAKRPPDMAICSAKSMADVVFPEPPFRFAKVITYVRGFVAQIAS